MHLLLWNNSYFTSKYHSILFPVILSCHLSCQLLLKSKVPRSSKITTAGKLQAYWNSNSGRVFWINFFEDAEAITSVLVTQKGTIANNSIGDEWHRSDTMKSILTQQLQSASIPASRREPWNWGPYVGLDDFTHSSPLVRVQSVRYSFRWWKCQNLSHSQVPFFYRRCWCI